MFSAQFAIRFDFVKTLEFRGDGGLNPPKPPFPRYATGSSIYPCICKKVLVERNTKFSVLATVFSW